MSKARITFLPDRRGEGSVKLIETHWGYILREADGAVGGVALAEAALRFLGLILVVSAYAQWLLPAALFPAGDVSGRIGLSAVLAVGGAAVYLVANRGFRPETQVDTAKREFRFARRNGQGIARIQRRLPFDAVESAFVRRRDGGAGELCLRLAGVEAQVHVATGAERDLEVLHLRLCRDLKSPAERVEARMKLVAVTPRKLAVRAPLRKTA